MKTRFHNLLFVTIAFISCHGKSVPRYSHQNDIVNIKVMWVDFDIESVIRIDCDNFEKAFNNGQYHDSISSINDIRKIVLMIKQLKRISNEYRVDVRGKMWLYHANNTIDTICFNDGILDYKNNRYKTPPKFIKFLYDRQKSLK